MQFIIQKNFIILKRGDLFAKNMGYWVMKVYKLIMENHQ